MSNERVHEALAPSTLFSQCQAHACPVEAYSGHDIAQHLEGLARDIVATPGAGGALLVAFAAQARALSLVLEAALRTEEAASLPAEVLMAVQNALRLPPSIAALELA